MKQEYGFEKPETMVEKWPGQYQAFSWMEYVTSIPQPLFLVTTYKENGKSNICFHAWSTFTGEGSNYFCIISILKHQHTYSNIIRSKEFCINFPDVSKLEECYASIKNNAETDNEIEKSGFTLEKSVNVNAPRINECFLNFECTLEWEKPLFENSKWMLLCGRVKHLAIEPERVKSIENGRYGKSGYMYNIHSPTNPIDGSEIESKIGYIEIVK
jgi:flavin reductase (DIM6/NTAB) family NADH-FMN oxidoreductase RutF